MKVINLTPHDVDICDRQGNVLKTYKASGEVARINHGYDDIDYVDGVPIVVRTDEQIVGLPKEQDGVMYIVSTIVLNECKDRLDLLAPVQQMRVRGQVVGCRSFMSNRRES